MNGHQVNEERRVARKRERLRTVDRIGWQAGKVGAGQDETAVLLESVLGHVRRTEHGGLHGGFVHYSVSIYQNISITDYF